jgi:hypothetical protein
MRIQPRLVRAFGGWLVDGAVKIARIDHDRIRHVWLVYNRFRVQCPLRAVKRSQWIFWNWSISGENTMARYISGLTACAVAIFVFAADTVLGEDMMKQDMMGMIESGTLATNTSNGKATPTGETKSDCMQKAAAETDSAKKSEMLKACDAIK